MAKPKPGTTGREVPETETPEGAAPEVGGGVTEGQEDTMATTEGAQGDAAPPVPPAEDEAVPAPSRKCKACGLVALAADEIEAGFDKCADCEEADLRDKKAGEATVPPAKTAGFIEELRKMGAIAGEAIREGVTHIVTKGGVRLQFPGDEAKAETLSISQLMGVAPENPAVKDGPLQPRTIDDLEGVDCIAARREYVAGKCGCGYAAPVPVDTRACPGCQQDDSFEMGRKVIQTTVVTKGGRKLTFPGDEAKAARLTDEELTGISRTGFPAAGVLSGGKK